MTSGVVFDGHGHVVVGTTLGIVRRALSAPLGDPWTVVAQPGTPGPYGFTFVNDVQVDPHRWHAHGRRASPGAAVRPTTTASTSRQGRRTRLVVDGDPDGINGRARSVKSSFAIRQRRLQALFAGRVDPEVPLQPRDGVDGRLRIPLRPRGRAVGSHRDLEAARELAGLSALGSVPGTRPAIQAWYNQYIGVDPSDPNHVYVGPRGGLRDPTTGVDAGPPIGPYWNFGLPCGADDLDNCPKTTHPDQHAVAFGRRQGVGGQRRRHLQPQPAPGPSSGTTTTPTCGTLQYYYGGAGAVPGGTAYWGGLQDNGGSLLLPGRRHDGLAVRRRRRRRDRRSEQRRCERVGVHRQRHVAHHERRAVATARTVAWREISAGVHRVHVHARARATRSRGSSLRSRPTRRRPTHWVSGGQYVWETGEGWRTRCDATRVRLEDRARHRRGESVTAIARQRRHDLRRLVRERVQPATATVQRRDRHELRRHVAHGGWARHRQRRRPAAAALRRSTSWSTRGRRHTSTRSTAGTRVGGSRAPASGTSSSPSTAVAAGPTSPATCRTPRPTTW